MEYDNPIQLDIAQRNSDRRPYDYQEKAMEELNKLFLFDKKKACILQIPTGGGKTYTAVRWIFNSIMHRGYKVVWIAHRIDLLLQARQTMIEESALLKGHAKKPSCIIIGGGYAAGTTLATAKEDIILLSSQTLAKGNGEKAMMSFCKKNKDNKILFVIDEAHHSAARSLKVFIKRDIEKQLNFKLLGLTATPTRTVEAERSVLLNLFGNNIICEININKLIKDGHLAWPKPEKINTNIDLEKSYIISKETRVYFETRHELDAKFLEAIGENSTRNKIIVDTFLNNRERYGKTLIFAIDKLHANTLKTEFEKHKDIRVDLTYSGYPNHDQVIRKFKEAELDVLINISKLTEGFDDPKIQTIFLTRPTQSEILFSQMIGRGLRGGIKGTKDVYLVSFEDHWEQFTGWLDTEKFTAVLGINDDEDEKTDTKLVSIIKKTMSFQVIEELYKQIKTLNLPELAGVPPFECWPLGWYTLHFDSDPTNQDFNLPITRSIIVFSHQKESWDELCKSISVKKPTDAERKAIYESWFADLPTPFVSRNIFDLFIDSCYATQSFVQPEYYTLQNRDEASTEKLAQELFDNSIGGKMRQDYINNWFEKYPLLSDIYGDLETFTEAVDDANRRISFPDKHRMTISAGEQYLKIDKAKITIPQTDVDKLKLVFNKLKANKELFPDGFHYAPSLEWTNRPMKSYFGIAYMDEHINKIKINRILNSNDIEQNENLIEFIMYHEMLHFSVSKNHNNEFRLHEHRYPDFVSLNSILDRIGLEYDIDSKYK